MWEAIRANRRKSAILVVVLGFVLLVLGAGIGESVADGGGIIGLAVALGIWVVMLLSSLVGGEQILLTSAGAREVARNDAPQLYNIVEEMKLASGLTAMPKVCIVDSQVPNAFAVGLKPERSAVAVTTGLLARLNRDELQGVIGHEMAHIANRDTLFLTLAGVTVGAVVMLADLYLRHIRFTAPRSRGSSDKGNGQAILLVLALVLAILAPLLANLLYFACSRRREYLADASGAQFTRYPDALASALEKIAGHQDPKGLPTNRTLAPMYIVNPLAAAGSSSSWFATHPPLASRVQILHGMGGAFSLAAYNASFRSTHPGRGVIGNRSLAADSASVAGRPSDAEASDAPDAAAAWRDAKEILHRVNQYFVIPCACGTKLKLPPQFQDKNVKCPRCQTVHDVPDDLAAAAAAMGALDETMTSIPPPLP